MMRKLIPAAAIGILTLLISLWGTDMRSSEANPTIHWLASQYPQVAFIRGNPMSKNIALTFDDGPDNNITLKILDVLKEKQVKATFFVLGIYAEKYPQILKRISQEGHFIGNHSWSHASDYNLDTLIHEVNETEKIITPITGQSIHLFRPPYGTMKEDHVLPLYKLGFQLIGWNSDSLDWQGISKDMIIANVLKDAAPGAIVLHHSFDSPKLLSTVKALPELINRLRKEGYTFVTVPELLADSGPVVIKINQEPVNFLSATCWPVIQNNITLTPLRVTFEKMEAQIAWDEQKNTITIKKNTKTITLKIGNPVAYVNNKQVRLDVPPQIDPRSNRTLVPLRFVSESMGAFIDWQVTGGKMVINIIHDNLDNVNLFSKTILPNKS